jgi:hypothetical protein
MSTSTASAALLAAAAAAMLLSTPSEAKPRRDGNIVRTCSLYGNGCITAPIRRGQYDYEFRLPGGNWISCKRDCKTTLREETVDFWETLRERSPGFRR